MKSILPLTLLCLVFNGCALIQRPDSNICVMNAPAQHMKCYNLKRDYNDDGTLKPTAKPTFRQFRIIDDGNKYISMDPDSFAQLKAYIKLLREEYQKGCKQ